MFILIKYNLQLQIYAFYNKISKYNTITNVSIFILLKPFKAGKNT